MGDNECYLCHTPDPAFLCLCEEVSVCRNCVSQHLLSNPSPLHKPLPLDRRELIQAVREEISQRTTRLSNTSYDRIKVINSLIKRELSRVQAFRTAAEVKLQQTKRMWESEIDRAVSDGKELIRSLTEKAMVELYQILTDISTDGDVLDKVWGEGRSEDEEMVDLAMDIRPVELADMMQAAIGVVVEMKNKLTSQTSALYKFFGGINQVGIFEVKVDEHCRTIPASAKFFHNSCSCVSANGLIYLTGGSLTGRSRPDAASFNPKTAVVTSLQPMLMARRSHASISIGTFCFVFGGLIEDDRSSLCERYDIENGLWKSLTRMNERRAYLGCCEFRSLVYLCGGAATPSCEVYNYTEDTFRLISFAEGSLDDYCCLLPLADTILVFHGNYQGAISRLWPESGRLVREREICYGNSWSSCAPILISGVVYMLRSESVFKYTLDSGESAYVLRIGKTVQRRLQFD